MNRSIGKNERMKDERMKKTLTLCVSWIDKFIIIITRIKKYQKWSY